MNWPTPKRIVFYGLGALAAVTICQEDGMKELLKAVKTVLRIPEPGVLKGRSRVPLKGAHMLDAKELEALDASMQKRGQPPFHIHATGMIFELHKEDRKGVGLILGLFALAMLAVSISLFAGYGSSAEPGGLIKALLCLVVGGGLVLGFIAGFLRQRFVVLEPDTLRVRTQCLGITLDRLIPYADIREFRYERSGQRAGVAVRLANRKEDICGVRWYRTEERYGLTVERRTHGPCRVPWVRAADEAEWLGRILAAWSGQPCHSTMPPFFPHVDIIPVTQRAWWFQKPTTVVLKHFKKFCENS